MSASLLKGPGIKTHEVADDLESYMHVLNWLCLRFFKTSHVNLRSYVSDSYDLVTKVGKHRTGGHEKYQAIKDGRAMANLEEKEGTPLKHLVNTLARMCQDHYQMVDSSPSSEPGGDRPRRHPIITIGGASPDTYKMSDIYYPRTRKDEPKVKKDDPLVDHRLFIAAFLIACSAPASEFPAKEEDKFAFFKDIHTEHSRPSSLYQSSAGSKRRLTELVSSSSSSSDEEQEEPPEKRLKLRSTKANRLRGLPEETLSSINGDEVTEDEYETEDSGASS
ncbi:hypothetical protein IEO21_06899 [Rhodonia placenta]|uniref:Fungal-type protein kinase domain-containing protein n=1 Tax=Rhodonia placenta TaxID=104341 RepID=A0A8H7NZ72_9APHY|nr:hypothetical protein IEO21_06899 [Postia placenta]